MRDFLHWFTEIESAKTLTGLNKVGKKIASFKDQPNFLEHEERIPEDKLQKLRELYKAKQKKLEFEAGTEKPSVPKPLLKYGDDVYKMGSNEIYVVSSKPNRVLGGLVKIQLKFAPKGLGKVEELIDPEILRLVNSNTP